MVAPWPPPPLTPRRVTPSAPLHPLPPPSAVMRSAPPPPLAPPSHLMLTAMLCSSSTRLKAYTLLFEGRWKDDSSTGFPAACMEGGGGSMERRLGVVRVQHLGPTCLPVQPLVYFFFSSISNPVHDQPLTCQPGLGA